MWRARRPRLLDVTGLARYRGLALRIRGGATERPGEQRVPGRTDAGGLEVEAWRPYVSGDDLRHLDWGALGRLDALLVRRYTAERQAGFHLLLDASASMGLPDGGVKLAAAREAAMALAYIALAGGDAVRTVVLAADGRTAASAWHRHRGAAARVADALAADVHGGALDLGTALGAYAERHAGPGVAVVLSDLMAEPEGVERGVVALRARRFAVVLVHVVAPSELDPRRRLPHGILRDAESGEEHAIGLTSGAVAEYRRLVDAHLAALRALARRTRSHYARLVVGQAVRDLVTGELARLGLVRRR